MTKSERLEAKRKFRKRKVFSINGIFLMVLFTFCSLYIADIPIIKRLHMSPLIMGILLGVFYVNSLRNHLPKSWVLGILYCSKTLLRVGVIFYGIRRGLTFANVKQLGLSAIITDCIIIASVIGIGMLLGKLFKIDRHTAMLTSVGSAICGAAAVLATEPVLNSRPYKAAIAVSTVVIFGTISIFVYPMLYRGGILAGMLPQQVGIYTGATIHEVAHVVGAADAIYHPQISNVAVVTKMIRVTLLAPFLVLLSFFITKLRSKKLGASTEEQGKSKITIPWFALGFLVMIGVNSLLPTATAAFFRANIEYLDTFILTMAMAALGTETNFKKFKQAGPKPFILALILFIYLTVGGFFITQWVDALLA